MWAETTTTTISPSAHISVEPNKLLKNVFVPLPYLLVIKAHGFSFQPLTTSIVIHHASILPFYPVPIVIDESYVWTLVIAMPSVITSGKTVDVTIEVISNDQSFEETIEVELFPAI